MKTVAAVSPLSRLNVYSAFRCFLGVGAPHFGRGFRPELGALDVHRLIIYL